MKSGLLPSRTTDAMAPQYAACFSVKSRAPFLRYGRHSSLFRTLTTLLVDMFVRPEAPDGCSALDLPELSVGAAIRGRMARTAMVPSTSSEHRQRKPAKSLMTGGCSKRKKNVPAPRSTMRRAIMPCGVEENFRISATSIRKKAFPFPCFSSSSATSHFNRMWTTRFKLAGTICWERRDSCLPNPSTQHRSQ